MSDNSDGGALIGIAGLGGCLVNLVIHAWTVILAYQIKGFWPMILTLVLPGAAEFYWAYMLWDTMRYYSIIAVTVVVLFAILKGVANAMASGQD